MSTKMSRSARLLLVAGLVALAAPVFAQQSQPPKPCTSGSDGDRPSYCEVRTMTVPPAGDVLGVDAAPNGGIAVRGWNRPDVQVEAKVTARADTEQQARALAGQVRILTDGGRLRAEGPRTGDGSNWSVSYDVMAPSRGNLDLNTKNGGISIEDVQGRLTFQTTNGGIQLKNVNGDVRGRTVNGGVALQLDGNGWFGEGLDVETTNGGVRLSVPDGYSAHIDAGTNMGGIHSDFPIKAEGEGGRTLNADLGSGGAPIHVRTVNGGVSIKKRQ